MSEQLERFITLLKGIFELDKSDLDFGIYRIMNIRKKEIEKFLEEGLPARVKDALAPFAANTADIEKRIAEIEKQCDNVGIEVAQSKMAEEYKQLKASLAKGIDLSGLEADVYSQLYSFFNRYYEEGDFISKRRYKEGVYAIPYEGEEVKLYWANQDQYYIKTSENFKDYTFVADGYNIHFRLVDATTEQNNNKESKDNKRVFMLYTEDPERPDLKTFEFDAEKKELIIRFVFDIPEDKKAKYEELNDKAITTWLIGNCQELVTVLLVNISSDPKKQQNLLQKHLRSYVAKNTFDYFIHKDLKKFLSRELDFFIKNEVMHLDDVDTTDEKRVDTWLAKVRAIKRVGHVIIDFLASIEDFQKKLWLKKKFVVQCDYCITLDRIPERFYKEIWSNEAQLREWQSLGFISNLHHDYGFWEFTFNGKEHQISNDSDGNVIIKTDFEAKQVTSKYDNSPLPQVVDIKTSFAYLLVDTKFFNQSFKEQLLACIDTFDEQCNGLLMQSENFQALNLLQLRYQEQIKCIYIDPPYNTGSDGFIYRDNYQHSNWLSLIFNRIKLGNILLNQANSFWAINVDKRELFNAKLMLEQALPTYEFVNALVNVNNPKGRSDQKHIPTAHDNIILYASDGAISFGWNPADKVLKRYRLQDQNGKLYREIDLRKTGDQDRKIDRPNMFYPFFFIPSTGELSLSCPQNSDYIEILPMKSENEEGRWRWEKDTALANKKRLLAKYMPVKQQWSIFEMDYLTDDERVFPTSVWDEKPFNSERGTETFVNMGFLKDEFKNPKPVGLMEALIEHLLNNADYMLDFFAGSGTTAHAIINSNRITCGKRKYILVDMGQHWQKILKPRVEKAIFSADWKDGKPQAANFESKKKKSDKTLGLDLGKDSLGFALLEDGELTNSGVVQYSNPYNGISHCFKYMRLESYEDALSNVELPEDKSVERMVSLFGDEYLIKYMLDLDTAGSVLNLAAFNDPFDYKLKVTEKNETKEVNADLMETFNYLIGLTVNKMYARKIFSATPDPAGEYDGAVKLTGNDNGEYIFRQIEGTLPSGERALIIWRNITDNLLESNAALDAYFQRYRINPADREFDVIFVNGDNNIANLKNTEETWKVRMIEPEFKTKMFEEE